MYYLASQLYVRFPVSSPVHGHVSDGGVAVDLVVLDAAGGGVRQEAGGRRAARVLVALAERYLAQVVLKKERDEI